MQTLLHKSHLSSRKSLIENSKKNNPHWCRLTLPFRCITTWATRGCRRAVQIACKLWLLPRNYSHSCPLAQVSVKHKLHGVLIFFHMLLGFLFSHSYPSPSFPTLPYFLTSSKNIHHSHPGCSPHHIACFLQAGLWGTGNIFCCDYMLQTSLSRRAEDIWAESCETTRWAMLSSCGFCVGFLPLASLDFKFLCPPWLAVAAASVTTIFFFFHCNN